MIFVLTSAASAVSQPYNADRVALDTTARSSGCPYDFASNMPAATFCVYRGVARDADGAVCAENVMMIWSTFDGTVRDSTTSARSGTRELYVGLVADPEIVLRGTVAPQAPNMAQLAGVDAPKSAAPIGQLQIRAVSEKSDVVSMELRSSETLSREHCDLASYSGTFIGLLHPTAD